MSERERERAREGERGRERERERERDRERERESERARERESERARERESERARERESERARERESERARERECKIQLYNLDSESNLDMRSILNPLESHSSLFMRPGSCPVWHEPVLILEPMPFGIVASIDAS